MKILYLTKYSRNAGSSRLRSYQYFPFLEKAGFEVDVSPLFSEKYLENLYAGKSTRNESLKGYFRRFFKLFELKKYNKVVIEKELFPYVPAFAEQILKIFGIKYFVDYDDAVFHNYDLSTNPIIRFFFKKKIDQVMKNAELVIAGNSYLAERAKKAGAKNIEIIPTVIDLERYSVKNEANNSEKFIIGWIGTKSTFEKHLLPCKNWMLKAQEDLGVEFHIVGITEDQNLGNRVSYFPWSEESEVERIKEFDLGIMPLKDSQWEKGKCAYKLIQYAACGIPGLASNVGMNDEVTKDGKTGFLANSENEFLEKIEKLKDDRDLRIRLGQNARKLVEKKYCIQVTAERWIKILNGK